jgi:hypothetical protein
MADMPTTRRTRVYVAGPISIGDQAVNVRNAILAASLLLEKGYAPYCPHLTHFWQAVSPHEYETWIALDLEWLPLCDCLLRLDGESKGADREVEFAKKRHIPVYCSVGTLTMCESPTIERIDCAPKNLPK